MDDEVLKKFADWLDKNYTRAEFGDYRSRYEGAVNILEQSGFSVERSGVAINVIRHTVSIKG